MAHIRARVLDHPPGQPRAANPLPHAATGARSRPTGRRKSAGSAGGGFRRWFEGSNTQQYQNPPVFFDQDPEEDEPAFSGFAADSILGGFNLNEMPSAGDSANYVRQDTTPNGFADGPRSATSGNVSNAIEEEGEEITSQPMVPYVGMTFDSIEEAQAVYNEYSFKLGFGTRIGNTKYSQARNAPPDTILSRIFECVHTGKPEAEKKKKAGSKNAGAPTEHNAEVDMSIHSAERNSSKQAGEMLDTSDTRQRRKLIRYDCKAHMLVGIRNGQWTVTVFKEEHTHPMVLQVGRRRFYRSHRKVPEEDFQFMKTLHYQNISTAQIMGCLGSVHGGDPRSLSYVKRDVSNIRTMLRQEITEHDMELTEEYFKQRQKENPNFFYATQVDKENAVRTIFWVDGRTRALYSKYKDCVFFDTTFCTNRYNMPFAPIVGINNHTHTIVLGCALLPDEKIETFKWVFEQWMLAMHGEHPDHIMADQDQAMATAIKEVFKNSIHRNCLYHILHLARKKLGPNLAEGNPFADAFYGCIYGTDTVEQFEACWQQMVQHFAMVENTHLQNMWKSRATWAPVYFRNRFFPFTSTTGRSEGLNSYFKTLIKPGDSVYNFVQQYELCQTLMLDREDNSGFTMETTRKGLWGSYGLEKQGQEFYTPEIFERFQKLVTASTKFYPLRAEVDGFCFDLVPNPGLDLKTYRVRVGFEEGLYSCSCNGFEMCGLICPHIIRVMVHLNVQQIPDRYMLWRWSAAATTPAPDPGTNGIRFGVPPTNTLKYNALCRKLNCLASDACYADDTYEVVSNMAYEASKVVAAMTRAREAVQQGEGEESDLGAAENGTNEMQQQEAVQDEQNQTSAPRRDGPLKNPVRVKPKGRPTNKEPRHKSLVELRDDANAKRRKSNEEPKQEKKKTVKKPRKKRVQKCPFCHEEGHFIADCPKARDHFLKEAALAAGAELRL